MKRTLSLLLAVLLCFSCFVPAGAAVLTRSAPAYKPSYVLTKTTFKSSTGEQYTVTCTYNKNFSLTKRAETTAYGSNTEYYSYDDNGRVVKITKVTDYGTYTDTFQYNAAGNVTKATNKYTYNGSTSTSSAVYSYDANGRLKKATEKSGFGDSTGVTLYSYDAKGNLIKEDYDYGIRTYSYDDSGNVIKTTSSDKSDTPITDTVTMKYDSKGNLVQKRVVSGVGGQETLTFTYNAAGKLTKEVKNSQMDESSTTVYTYGSNGKVNKKTVKHTGGGTDQFVYKYDANGNNTKVTYKYSTGETGTYTFAYKKVTNSSSIVSDAVWYGFDGNSYKLSYTAAVYNGKYKKPAVSVYNSYWYGSAPLIQGRDYRVTYLNNKAPGKGKVKITFNFDASPVIITFNIKPVKPTALKTAAKTKTSVTLTWNKVAGAKKYIVYKYAASTGKYTKVAAVTTNRAVIKNLKAYTAYKFCVKAVASGGVSGALSAKLTVRTAK